MNHRAALFLVPFVFLALLAPRAVADDRESFDLATFVVPKGWTKSGNRNALRLTQTSRFGYCNVNLYAHAPSTGDAKGDFARDWQQLVVKGFHPGKATKLKRPAIRGWSVAAGRSSFVQGKDKVLVTLATYTRESATFTVLTLANHKGCDALFKGFFSQLALPSDSDAAGSKPATGSAPSKDAAQSSASGTAAVKTTASAASTSNAGGFQFVTSNFDDGWEASIATDWVMVTKGSVRVYLYFTVPYDAANFSGTGVMDRDYYWKNYVGKQFDLQSTMYRDDGEVVSSLKPSYVEGWGKDRVSGERRYLGMALGVSPNSAMITLASAPDDKTLHAAFPKANDRWASDLRTMSRYNKFAVAPKEVVGTWQNNGSQTAEWYDRQSGDFAGISFAASSATFAFAADGSYTSIHNGATGAVGNMSTFQQEYRGRYTISNWSVTATKRFEGRTDVFAAHFQIVRNGRLLALDDGRGGSYVLVRTKR